MTVNKVQITVNGSADVFCCFKAGKQFSVCEASIHNEEGQLLASGRGVYAMPAPPKAA